MNLADFWDNDNQRIEAEAEIMGAPDPASVILMAALEPNPGEALEDYGRRNPELDLDNLNDPNDLDALSPQARYALAVGMLVNYSRNAP